VVRQLARFIRFACNEWYRRSLLAVADIVPQLHNGPGCTLKARLLRLTGIRMGAPVFVDHGFRCIQPHNITIDPYVSLGHDNHIWAFTPVHIGHHTITAKDLLIISASHDVASLEPLDGQQVEIGPGCWIGARVTILGGVTIGRGCVIGAGAVVRSSLPDWSVAAGVPARVIKTRTPSDSVWNHFGTYSRAEIEIV
jgi:acetyltransferase-like isoleucine patch superfamily enzyme